MIYMSKHSASFICFAATIIDLKCVNFRFDPSPVSGRTQGLTLILDAHSDLVTASSITDYFQVCVSNFDMI